MAPAERSGFALDRIRRLRGVSWEWRPDAPIDREGREAGVIAQDVRAVLPDLVVTAPEGHLTVDYGGLSLELARAMQELGDRIRDVELDRATRPSLSDGEAKQDVTGIDPGDDPVTTALANLEAGRLRGIDHTALVGTLVEAVKELDHRLAEIESRIPEAGPTSSRSEVAEAEADG